MHFRETWLVPYSKYAGSIHRCVATLTHIPAPDSSLVWQPVITVDTGIRVTEPEQLHSNRPQTKNTQTHTHVHRVLNLGLGLAWGR